MGKLAHIKQDMNGQSMMDGIVRSVGEYVASVVANKLSEDMARGGDGLKQIQAAVGSLQPTIQAAVSSAVAQIVREVGVARDKSKSEIQSAYDKLTGTQQALMKALTQVKIPDYSESIRRLESKAVDLSPIERQIQAVLLKLDIDEEKEPTRWVFHVERNKNGLIDSVTAEAEE